MVVTSSVTCAVLRKYAFITVVVFSNEMSLLNYLQLIVFMTSLLALCLVVKDPLDVAFPLVYIYGACVSKEFHLYMWDQSLWCHGSLTRGPWVKAEGCHDDKLATSSCIRCYTTTLSAQVVVNMTTSVQPVMTIQGSKLRGAEGQNAPKLSPNAPRLLNLGAKFCYPIQPDICFEV